MQETIKKIRQWIEVIEALDQTDVQAHKEKKHQAMLELAQNHNFISLRWNYWIQLFSHSSFA